MKIVCSFELIGMDMFLARYMEFGAVKDAQSNVVDFKLLFFA